MDNIEEKWSKNIKSVINCDEIIFKQFKYRLVELTLKSKLFTNDLLMGDTVFGVTVLGDYNNCPESLAIMNSKIDFRNNKCFLLKISENEEAIIISKKAKWIDLKE